MNIYVHIFIYIYTHSRTHIFVHFGISSLFLAGRSGENEWCVVEGWGFGGNHTFLIALCWWKVSTRWLHPSNISAHTQSFILCGNCGRGLIKNKKQGAQQWEDELIGCPECPGLRKLEQPTSRYILFGTRAKSCGAVFLYLLSGKIDVQDQKKKTDFWFKYSNLVIHINTEHDLKYLCSHPCLLLTSLAFGVLDCCIWPQPPDRNKQFTLRSVNKNDHDV